MLALALGIVVLAQIGPGSPIVTPPQNTTTNTIIENRITVEAPPPDPAAIAEASVQSGQAMLVSIITPPPVEFTNELLNLPDLWRTTPASLTYEHPEIRKLSEMMRDNALAMLALAIFAIGLAWALGEYTGYGGRVVYAVVLSIGSLAWWQIGIQLNNAMCAAIGAPDLPSIIRPHIEFASLDPAGNVTSTVLVLVYSIVALMLLFSLLFRLGMLMVLIAIGPLALLMYATPQTEGLAQTYTRLAVGMLFSQVLIVVGFRLATVLSSVGSGVAGTLLGIVILLLIGKLPGLLSSGGRMQSGGRGMLASLAMMVAMRRFRFR